VTQQVSVLGQNRTEIPAKPSYFNKISCMKGVSEEVEEKRKKEVIHEVRRDL